MATPNPAKKTKKPISKTLPVDKTAAVPVVAESSSKPAKTLKRKKDAELDVAQVEEEVQPTSAPKKAKKDIAAPSKPVKSTEKSTEPKTKAAKPAKDTSAPYKPVALVSILKKSKDTPAPVEPAIKKSKRAEPIPTSISRRRKPEVAAPAKSKKTKTPAPFVEEVSDEEIEDAQEADKSDAESEEEGHLHGFSTDDDDSSDEDAMDDEPTEFDIGSLPTVAKDDASVKWKLEKAKKEKSEDRGVLFLGRLPHGFYEDQLKAYFSQFGNVTRIRVSRNKKTGKSKHYGFIEFDSSAVAQIVADTMDNYLLMGHILRCKLIPKDEVHPELWVGANRKWRVVPQDRVQREAHNKLRTEEEKEKATKRLLKRQHARKLKLEKAGIKYDFDAVGYKNPAPVKA